MKTEDDSSMLSLASHRIDLDRRARNIHEACSLYALDVISALPPARRHAVEQAGPLSLHIRLSFNDALVELVAGDGAQKRLHSVRIQAHHATECECPQCCDRRAAMTEEISRGACL